MKVIPSCLLSLPAWGARIEMYFLRLQEAVYTSLPAWGARIEMNMKAAQGICIIVAPRMGSEDRNSPLFRGSSTVI